MEQKKYQKLLQILKSYKKVAVAFSGGVDSTLLLAAAKEAVGENCVAITAVSELNPHWETEEADSFCKGRGIRHVVVQAKPLSLPAFVSNPKDRCYHCKKALFQQFKELAEADGFTLVEGSNTDDLTDYRPGRKALQELAVKSPLLEAGLSKQEIRNISEELMLPTWYKPSFACLASRVPYGEPITKEKLHRIDLAETYLKDNDFPNFRVRCMDGGTTAKIEVEPVDIPALKEILPYLRPYYQVLGFTKVIIDEEGYRRGSLNEGVTV